MTRLSLVVCSIQFAGRQFAPESIALFQERGALFQERAVSVTVASVSWLAASCRLLRLLGPFASAEINQKLWLNRAGTQMNGRVCSSQQVLFRAVPRASCRVGVVVVGARTR